MDNAAYLPFARLTNEQLDLMALPEEVREALEAHRDEFHSAADLKAMVNDLMQRK